MGLVRVFRSLENPLAAVEGLQVVGHAEFCGVRLKLFPGGVHHMVKSGLVDGRRDILVVEEPAMFDIRLNKNSLWVGHHPLPETL